MNNRLQARRYAEALYEVAVERAREGIVFEELELIRPVLTPQSELVQFLQNPKNWLNRARVIRMSFQNFSTELVKTLLIMVEEHEELNIEHMIEQYQALYYDGKNIATGKIYTTVPISDAGKSEIEEKFADKFGYERLKLTNVIDPDVVGGFKIIVNQKIFDASLQGRIDKVKREFVPLYKR